MADGVFETLNIQRMKGLGIYRTDPTVEIPKFATDGSACFDIKAHLIADTVVKTRGADSIEKEVPVYKGIDGQAVFTLQPFCRALIPTGMIVDIPDGYSMRIHSRSGLSWKNGIMLANGEGVVDFDYVEPVFVILFNSSSSPWIVTHGDKICQAELVKMEKYDIFALGQKPIQKTTRIGGFGSTGK